VEIVWTRGAEADLAAIYEELEERQAGSGDRLLLQANSALELLRYFPEMAPSFDPPIRRLLLNRRRHGLYYTVENRGIIIHAVANLHTDPAILRTRFRKLRGH
jgi:plasmid stabilization system protein ParE